MSRYPFHAGRVASAVKGPWGRWEWRKSVRSEKQSSMSDWWFPLLIGCGLAAAVVVVSAAALLMWCVR